MFSWIPIYTELAKKLLPYRDQQDELIKVVKAFEKQGRPVGSTYDYEINDKKVALAEMEPFTFFGYFNRNLKDDNRLKMLAHVKTTFQLQSELPTDFDGIPVVNNQNAWFFPFKRTRKADDISSLWQLAEAVVGTPPESLAPELFDRCLQIESVGAPKLTMGMFWINPKDYVALDANNRKLFEGSGIGCEVRDLSDYLQILTSVRTQFGTDFAQISRMAWEAANDGDAFVIDSQQLAKLWTRFRERISGFESFELPGDPFQQGELGYKRKVLKRYQEELGGNTQLRKWVEAGQGDKARDEISKRIQSNLVAYQSWRTSIGANDKQSAAVLRAFLDAAEAPYAGPSTVEPIIQITLGQGLKPAWDTLSTLLWAMRPADYFPVKISYYRELAEEIGHPLPSGTPTANTFDEVQKFGRAFWKALEPQKPADWVDVQSFIWVVCPSSYDTEKHYWAGGFQWGETSKLEEFIQGNFWQIGWDKDEIKPAAKKTWAHFEQVKVGDEFAIKGYGGRNDLVVHYIGEVVGKEDDGILRLKKLERPLYKGKAPTGLTGTSWFDTLVAVSPAPIIDAIFYGAPPGPPNPEPPQMGNNTNSLNLILFGPPGTGKTYETVERAVKIILPDFSGEHAAYKQQFDELTRQGRIDFVTFHQSYSYEDFVEGIRPVLDSDDEGGYPRYECRAGIFKRLAISATFNMLEKAETTKGLLPFSALWNALLSKLESEPEAQYPGLSNKTSYQLALTARGNLEGTNVLSDKRFLCSRKILQEVYEARRTQDTISVSEVMEVVGRGCHSQLVAAVFNELRRIERSPLHNKSQQMPAVTPDEKADVVRRFLADGAKSGYQLRPESQWMRFVLVIDEINRGNISKILGELITLVEPDKRLGARESLSAILPYSGEHFAVPANLHILATMNTADKSIALVDLALRRRFDFAELPVDLTVCAGLSEHMRQVLQELNRRIALRKDRDHQIGHAYFVNVNSEESFDHKFRKQIIPLLQEYFYNDWDGLRYVLGEDTKNVPGERFIRKVPGAEIKEARTKWEWCLDVAPEKMTCLAALRGNYGIG